MNERYTFEWRERGKTEWYDSGFYFKKKFWALRAARTYRVVSTQSAFLEVRVIKVLEELTR